MTSARPYRSPLAREEAARRIAVEGGRQFDTMAVDAFLAIEGEFHALREAALRASG
jgi:HD-GYP domain-containing protein (c-di-GMP phosphodiesterase class II)